MEIFVTAALCYLAIGAAFFAHPASPAVPDDFHWRRQIGVFRASLPEVLGWLYDRLDQPDQDDRLQLAFDKLNTGPLIKLLEGLAR